MNANVAEKIERITYVDQVFNAIQRDIANKTYTIGDRLPSEAELAEKYGVNRITVRMALQKLNTLGVAETRMGQGTYIRDFSFSALVDDIQEFFKTHSHFQEVQQFRFILELGSVRLADVTGTEEEVERLMELADIYDRDRIAFIADDTNKELEEKMHDSDLNIHKYIVKMSHNSLIIDIYEMIIALIHENVVELAVRRAHRAHELGLKDLPINTHRLICESIRDHNVEMAVGVYQELLGLIPARNDI